jgi:hypothetical protein
LNETRSDVLRVATLFKFGGTYIDTDVITLAEHPHDKNYLNFEEPGSNLSFFLSLHPTRKNKVH